MMGENVGEWNDGVLRWRITNNTSRIEKIEDWRRDSERAQVRMEGEIESLEDAVKTIASELKGVKSRLTAFAFTIAGSAVVFSLSVLVATGKVGG